MPFSKEETMTTMSLHEKLASFDYLTKLDALRELDGLLGSPYTVSITWAGCRRVTFEGYTGDADISEIAGKFLQAIPCSDVNPGPFFDSAKQKLHVLCNDDTSLKNLYIYRYLVPVKELIYETSRELFMFYDNSPWRDLSLDKKEDRCEILDRIMDK